MNLFRQNPGEVVGGEVWLHDLDVLAMLIFGRTSLLRKLISADLSPIALVARLG